ncbi:unnamed protein product [Eruca vesicaria subsp. sativa]|uniref:Ubiquitin receptor RAD23 n=1 Tax=Eruca vesicaria subsp. sativa TaxID=29727 RepID=A0ABC8LV50_ERUVS|nr:unnamed protein product [Eruca vesicaria subsp. sativa]
MKIFVKTLKGDRFQIQVNPEDSVADVKKNIETVVGVTASYPAAEQMLIHKGKVLKDETTVEANNVSEKSTICVMKRKPASTGTSPPTEPASAGESSSYVASGRVSESNTQKILEMVGIGWNREMVTSALYLAYDDIDTALEYLYLGFPEQSEDPYITSEGTQDQTQEPESPDEADEERLFNFFYTPEHEYLRDLVQSDPLYVKDFVEMLEERDPPLFELIQDNKALFLRLLLEVEGGTRANDMVQPQEIQADQTNEPNNGGDGGNQVKESEETEVKQPQADQTNKPNKGGDGDNLVGESKETEVEVATTPEDNEWIEQLEALVFESNRNVQGAENHLLDDNHKPRE